MGLFESPRLPASASSKPVVRSSALTNLPSSPRSDRTPFCSRDHEATVRPSVTVAHQVYRTVTPSHTCEAAVASSSVHEVDVPAVATRNKYISLDTELRYVFVSRLMGWIIAGLTYKINYDSTKKKKPNHQKKKKKKKKK